MSFLERLYTRKNFLLKRPLKYWRNNLLKVRIILIGIGCVHGLTNMGGSFLAIYSTLVSHNKKEIARYYICYGYLIMGILQYCTVIFLSLKTLEFNKLFYILFALVIYFPSQKLFKNIKDKKFSKYINIIALLYGLLILISYY